VSGCETGGGFFCFADALVGGYWITVDAHDRNSDHKVSIATANARLGQIMKVVVPALKQASDPADAWVAPTDPGIGFCDKKNNVADVRKALKSPGLNYDDDPGDNGAEVSGIAFRGAPWSWCDWFNTSGDGAPKGQVSDAGVNILQGGGWLIAQVWADPPTQAYVGPFKPITVPGTTGAVLACNSADCEAIVGLGANAASITFSDLGSTRNLASVTAMVAAISAS
jgi:hypothetical protein